MVQECSVSMNLMNFIKCDYSISAASELLQSMLLPCMLHCVIDSAEFYCNIKRLVCVG